jgi:CRP-like cAMP-binding protein
MDPKITELGNSRSTMKTFPVASLHDGHNRLLRAEAGRLGQLRAALEPVRLETSQTLVELNEVASHVYFPNNGVISLLSATRRGDSVEVGAIGREGVAALTAMLGSGRSPFRLLVQVPGNAFRVESGALLDYVHSSPAFRERLLRYLNVLVGQITQSAVCNRYHKGQRRLARWLLAVSDRAESDVIPVTHEFAANMVGDLRPRVTAAMRALRDRGLIRHRRAEITILDRQGLRGAACECYTIVQDYFDHLDTFQ